MPTVDSTVGGASANSYVAVADADAYFLDSFGRSLWATASEKEALVITASRILDQYMDWNGLKTDSNQSMEWPRTGAYNKAGQAIDSTIVPGPVKFAVYELAYYLLENGGLTYENQSLESVKVGAIALRFDQKLKELGIPGFVIALIQHLGMLDLSSSNKIHSVNLIRS